MSHSRRQFLVAIGGVLAACSPARPTTNPPQIELATATPATMFTPTRPTATPLLPTATPVAQGPPATAVVARPTASVARVQPGIDVLLSRRRELLAGKRLGLVTNASGMTADGRSSIDALNASGDWQLVALFSPEHGIRGESPAGESVDSSADAATGLPVHSLYGTTTRPTDAMLRGLEILAYDIQDIGARPYTYISTLLEVMRACAAHRLPLLVMDRPDPIGGDQVDGNVLDPAFASFVGPAPIAMRYAMTVGELSQWFNAELQIGADLTVVPMSSWRRGMWFDETGLAWLNPSPNIRSLSAATLYPGTVLFEGTNLSEGRGTDRPFEWIGAPWMDAHAWTTALTEAAPPGVRFAAVDRTPDSSKFAGQTCHGVAVEIVQRSLVRPVALAIAMLVAAGEVAGRHLLFTAGSFDAVAGTDQLRLALERGRSADQIVHGWASELAEFEATRHRWLIYPS